MKVADAVAHLRRILDIAGPCAADLDLVVPVHAPGSVGGTPRVAVSRITVGIDWDHGVVFAQPGAEVTLLKPEEVAAIMESVRKGQSWHAYQQYKKQADRIKALCAVPDALVQFFDEWEQVLPADAREALRAVAEQARTALKGAS